MTGKSLIIAILVGALVTFTMRALPFFAFNGDRKMPAWLDKLGQTLPGATMAVLVVYCLKDVGDDFSTNGLAKIIASVVVAISYKIKHSTFLSIVLGTACCMILMRVL